jgi:hypothetical protein
MQTQPDAPSVHALEQTARSSAFGLSIEVDHGVDVPGITEASTQVSGPTTRVRLDPTELERRWNAVAHTAERVRELGDGESVLLTVDLAAPAGYLLHAPGFARILIAMDGTEVLCDPEPGNLEWSALLPAQALPLAATLKGLEVLHASGVLLDEKALLFTGPPGAGKSSLAAAMLRRGAVLLSDDTVALQTRAGELIAHPGAGALHLRADEHDRLSTDERAALGSASTFLEKKRYSPPLAASPAPFGELFLLERTPHGPPIERIERVDPFELLASTFNLSVRTPERLVRHLDLAVALTDTRRIYRLRIQPNMNATQLADALHQFLMDR